MRAQITACLALVFSAGIVLAHAGVQNPAVMARMEGMKSMGEATAVLGDMAKGKRAFDAADARAAAAAIAEGSAASRKLFEAPEQDPKSEALPAIWQDYADFSARATALETLATELAQDIAAPGDLAPALAELGAACKDCHARYRE